MIMLALHCIVIHTCNPGIRESFCNQFFNFFSPEIPLLEIMAAALRAGIQHGIFCAAVMANHFVLRLVIRKCYVTVFTLRDPATHIANQVRRVAAAVLEKDHLLFFSKRVLNGFF